jgi:diguanylate cyclase (GGDEF)-like protein
MLVPEDHPNENQRIKTLQSLNVLDTPSEARLDRLTHIVSNMFNVPIALVSLVDVNRQWFKSCVGIDATETPRDISFCGHAILEEGVLIIEDTLNDDRFADNPLVTDEPKIRFYAGCPLVHPNGSPLGTLCLIDREPRTFDAEEALILKEIATLVELELVQQHSTTMDTDTQLSNKEGFLQLGKHSLEVCKRLNLQISVAFLYVKGLANYIHDKEIHSRALTIISQQFSKQFRSSDVVARYDEAGFVALMTNTSESSANQLLSKVVENTNADLDKVQAELGLELVTGLVTSPATAELESLVFNAFVKLHE